jgi:hypothetical protein
MTPTILYNDLAFTLSFIWSDYFLLAFGIGVVWAIVYMVLRIYLTR